MSEKHPLRIVISNLIPRDILSDLRNRVQNQDWDSFFTSLIGVGGVSLISSLCIVVLVVLLSRVITGTIDPVSLIFNILTNLTLLATLGYVLALLMLSWIKSTVEGEPVLTEQSKRVESFLDFSEERTWLQFGFYMLNLIISVLFITLVIVFRSSLILSANIVASATGLLERGVLILLMFGLDLAYLGLVLVLVGQLYETGKSLRRL